VDLVVLSEVRWGYFRTRKQFLLSRFPKDWRIFFAQPPVATGDDPWTPRQEGRVTYFTVPFLKPITSSAPYNALAHLPPVRAGFERLAEAHLRRQLSRLGVEPDPIVLCSNIYACRLLSRLSAKLVFYDFNDSPFQFAGVPRWARGYWKRTLDQVDAFFVVSEHYRRQLSRETSRPVVLLPNGVEVKHFETRRDVPADLKALPRPLIGYVGLLSHFLDFEVLEALRRERRGGTLVLIGPGSPATDERVAALAGREGVAHLGPRPYEEIPAYMQALDVGLIPFRAQDPFVRGINPNKVYQYLAAGCPVVTTPLLDLETRPPHLLFASDPDACVAAVRQILENPGDAEVRRDMARSHDWDALATRMVEEMERRIAGAA
jgi:glycosyltransferase involved in cell wall biosynthesis